VRGRRDNFGVVANYTECQKIKKHFQKNSGDGNHVDRNFLIEIDKIKRCSCKLHL